MIATGAISLFGLSSCFQIESTINVKKDGSGTVTEEMILGEQMKMMLLQAGGAGGQDPMAKMLDKAKAEVRAKTMGEGVELVRVEKIEGNGKLGVRTTFKFADINQLKYSANGAMDMGGAPDAGAQKADDTGLRFKLVDGTLNVIQKAPQGGAKGDKPEQPEMDPQQLAMMQGMMKDMRVTTKIKIEPGIKKTNATYVNGDTIVLSDIQMGKLLADPSKLNALQGGDFDEVKKALKGVDGIKFEDKESVSVEMK